MNMTMMTVVNDADDNHTALLRYTAAFFRRVAYLCLSSSLRTNSDSPVADADSDGFAAEVFFLCIFPRFTVSLLSLSSCLATDLIAADDSDDDAVDFFLPFFLCTTFFPLSSSPVSATVAAADDDFLRLTLHLASSFVADALDVVASSTVLLRFRRLPSVFLASAVIFRAFTLPVFTAETQHSQTALPH